MKTAIVLTLSFITHLTLKTQSGPEINFWDTANNSATLRVPLLISTDVRQANNNSAAYTQSFDTSTLSLRIEAIQQGNLVINHELKHLSLTREWSSNEQLTQEQINLLVEYYPNITSLFFDGFGQEYALEANRIAGIFKQVKQLVIATKRIKQTEELMRMIASLQSFVPQ